jgi:multidrug efflux system membrane fusion protein
MNKKLRRATVLLLSASLVVVVAVLAQHKFSQMNGEQTAAQADNAKPAPVVETLTLQPQQVRKWSRYSGRLTAVNEADIKPQVKGEIVKVYFHDGQQVAQGDPLFLIDPKPYQAAVDRAQAQLLTAQSRAKLAKDELARAAKLVAGKLVSESVYDTANNSYQVAMSAIDEANSQLIQARLDLGYCTIKAPFSGRLSRAELTLGNIVNTAPNAPVLTRLVANDKLYAEFDVDEQSYIRLMRGSKDTQQMPVEMRLAAADAKTYHGHIAAFDNQIDIGSGTIRARAVFDNVDGMLTPGMFVNVRVGQAELSQALLIPQKAVITNQAKKFVYVLNADNSAEFREVTLGSHHDSQREVVSGLSNGDTIVVNGLSHIRPGTVVNPQPLTATDNN